ncbi:MAG TPA: hypothetical protein GXX26_01440 [Clostridiaceae bacterium]|nr:hypothetical protein [Clostridiaceae bacterium]
MREAIDLGLIPADMQKDYAKNITRAEFCRLTVVLLENIYETTIEDILSQRGVTPDKAVFTDTHDPDILAANALGIVFGDGKGIFNPHGEIKRGEAAAMLMRTASLTGEYHALPHVFDDASWFPAWARESAYAAYAYGIMVGDNMNRFHPVSFYTRQETYVTILRLYNTIKNGAREQESLYPMSAKNEEGIYLWGYINQNGTFVIEPKYTYASEWNGQYGIVSLPDEPDAYIVIDRDENLIIEVDDLRELIPEKVTEKTPPCFFGNTLYVGEYYKFLFSLPDGEWLTGDYKGGGARSFNDGIIRAFDGFSKRWYYLDRNGKTITSDEEWFWFGGDFYKGVAIVSKVAQSGETKYLLWSTDCEKKTIIIDSEKYIPQHGMAVGDLMVVSGPRSMDESYNFLPAQYGVIRADGIIILPADYEALSLTLGKQILARKNAAEPYSLFDETGKKIFEFNPDFDGELLFDSIGYYMFRSGDKMMTVISNTGTGMCNIEINQDASFRFISGLIQITESNGTCRYYTVAGNSIFHVE